MELRPLCVMIGANGVGKTSMLDVLSLLGSSAAGRLSSSISELGGLTSVLSYDKAQDLELGITMGVEGHQPLQYGLKIRPEGVAYRIERESLSQKRKAEGPPFYHVTSRGPNIQYFEGQQGKLVRPNWEYNPLETSLSQVPKMFREPEEFRSRLVSSTRYHVLDVPAVSSSLAPTDAASYLARQEWRRVGVLPFLFAGDGTPPVWSNRRCSPRCIPQVRTPRFPAGCRRDSRACLA